MRSPLKIALDKDPLRIRKYDTPLYRLIYSLCVMVPTLIAIAILLFLVFFLSPRGRNMRLFQRYTYEWNKDNNAEKFSKMQFAYKIIPYAHQNWTSKDMIQLEYKDNVNYTAEEQSIQNLLEFQQSYFYYNNTLNVFPSLNLSINNMPIGNSDDFWVHVWWKNQTRDKIYSNFQNLDNQQEIPQLSNMSHLLWTKNDPINGIKFKLWREKQISLWCTNSTCENSCNYYQGIFYDGKCYQYELINSLCLKVEHQFDNKNKSGLAFAGGCFQNGDIGFYKSTGSSGIYSFDWIPVEIRLLKDPFTVIQGSNYDLGKDFTLLFWISAGALVLAFICTFTLFIMFCFIVRKSRSRGGPYVKDSI